MESSIAVVSVTLSPELLLHLRAESRRLELPIEYLVAALVVDTIEGNESADIGGDLDRAA
jgi:hypothetical protein